MATEVKLTRTKMQRLLGKAGDLERDADDYRTAGLDDRAEKLEADAAKIRERVEASKKAHQQQERERRRRDREAQERHDKAQRELKEQMERRSEVREWYRSWQRLRGGFPQPAERVLAAAEEDGHDPQDVESALTRVKRLKNGVHCFTFRGEYLRGKYRPVEELPGRVKV